MFLNAKIVRMRLGGGVQRGRMRSCSVNSGKPKSFVSNVKKAPLQGMCKISINNKNNNLKQLKIPLGGNNLLGRGLGFRKGGASRRLHRK